MPYTWINEPPIMEIGLEELDALFTQTTWDDWCNDIYEVQRVLGPVEREGWNAERFFVYILFGQLAGAVAVAEHKMRGLIGVWALATHPGVQGAGSILIEHVVNLSEKGGGRVELRPLVQWKESFAAKGFLEDPSIPFAEFVPGTGFAVAGTMSLVASQSDKWVKLGEEWRLKKYQDRKGFFVPAEDVLSDLSWRQLTVWRETLGRLRP